MNLTDKIFLIGGVLFAAVFLFGRKGNKPETGPNGFIPQRVSGRAQKTVDEIKSIAKAQFDSMTVLGTKDRVFTSLNGLNADDLRGVYNAFGVKKYLGASGSGIIAELFGTPLDLWGWYTEELKGADLNKMRSIWKAQGVTTTF